MGLAVLASEARGVDLRIDLSGREAGVTKELLYLAKVAAGAQEVRCKRMSQGMGRRCIWEAQLGAQLFHQELDNSRAQGPALGAEEKGIVWL